jgi:hypothetical protein
MLMFLVIQYYEVGAETNAETYPSRPAEEEAEAEAVLKGVAAAEEEGRIGCYYQSHSAAFLLVPVHLQADMTF